MLVIHLTKRALEFLVLNRMPDGGYKSAAGRTACGESPDVRYYTNWCRTEDVKAMARGTQVAWVYHPLRGERLPKDVRSPTCPKCAVLLDAALAACPPDPIKSLLGVMTLLYLETPNLPSETRGARTEQWFRHLLGGPGL